MFDRIFASAILALYLPTALVWPVTHEIFCPVDGTLAVWARAGEHSCDHSHGPDGAHQDGTSEVDLENNTGWLAERSLTIHCAGDCLASLVQTSESLFSTTELVLPPGSVGDSIAGCTIVRLSSTIHVHARGPPHLV